MKLYESLEWQTNVRCDAIIYLKLNKIFAIKEANLLKPIRKNALEKNVNSWVHIDNK
jgi:hypothetical protein